MNDFEKLLLELKPSKVVDASIDYTNYTPIDLSSEATDLLKLNPTDAHVFEHFIEKHLVKQKAKVAFGGYLEKRNLYKRSAIFTKNEASDRNIHLGIDLWIKAGIAVLAALDGTIHSFKNNTALSDYGPTIILKHTYKDTTFYTLYGHLSAESLMNCYEGKTVKKGECIAKLGAAPINGDYAPHLHFQIIKDLEDKNGDYPGVCSLNTFDFYKTNCPDPNLLLKIK